MKKTFIALCCFSLLQGCNLDLNSDDSNQAYVFDYNFESGNQGWTAGFSDYPSDYEDLSIYELSSGVTMLPATTSKHGFHIAGHNRSDDLFMFIKTRVTGLQASSRYSANIKVSFLSAAGDQCFGIGGSPGSSVYVKFGFGETEPKQADYYLSLDKGNQASSGANANIIGDVAIAGKSCESENFVAKTLTTTSTTELKLSTNADGSIWLFIGTDSAYEGYTKLYYDQITITLAPTL